MANLTVLFNFTPDPPWLPRRRNLGQNGLELGLRRRFLRDFYVYRGGLQQLAIECCQLHFSPTDPVAMATTFGTKLAITRLA